METIPPTQDALLQHRRRVVYQAGICSISNKAQRELPSPEGYGWKLSKECKWSPVWITLPVASKACTELVECGCKSSRGCGGRFSCKEAQWRCTELCIVAIVKSNNYKDVAMLITTLVDNNILYSGKFLKGLIFEN